MKYNPDDVKQLEQEAQELSSEISARQDRLAEIHTKIQQYHHDELLAEFSKWQIKPGQQLVLFAKNGGSYHWNILRTIYIREVCTMHNYVSFDCLMCTYSESDDDYIMQCCTRRVTPGWLVDLQSEVNAYVVDSDAFQELQRAMLNLEIDYRNYRAYEATIADKAISTLSF